MISPSLAYKRRRRREMVETDERRCGDEVWVGGRRDRRGMTGKREGVKGYEEEED